MFKMSKSSELSVSIFISALSAVMTENKSIEKQREHVIDGAKKVA